MDKNRVSPEPVSSRAVVIVFGPEEGVDYDTKKTSPVKFISKYPRKFYCWKKFKPKYTVYDNRQGLFYVLSDDDLLICDGREKYDPKHPNNMKIGTIKMKGSFGFPFDLKVKDMTLTESGDLLLIDERHAFSVTAGSKLTRMADFTRAIQICSHDKVFVVLDIGHEKCLQIFTIGSGVGECKISFGDEELADKVNAETVMCLDRSCNLYVTAGCEVKRREEGQILSYRCQRFKNVTVTFQMLIARYDEDGNFDDYIRLEDKTSFLGEIESFCPWYHGHKDFPAGINPKQEVPNDEEIKHMTRIRGIFVDYQGRIIIARPRMNRIDVYTEHGKHQCTILEPGRHQGKFERPTGVCLTTDGKLVVSDPVKRKLLFL